MQSTPIVEPCLDIWQGSDYVSGKYFYFISIQYWKQLIVADTINVMKMQFAYHWISWENTHANVDQISQEMDSTVPLIVKIAKVSLYLVRWQRRFSAHCQTTIMEFFAKLLTVFTKRSMVDVYQGSKYSSRWIILSK